MSESLLRPSDDVGQADWIRPRLAPFGSAISAVVPGGFPAYVRVFHPAYSNTPGELVRWAEVAARAGTTMYELAQFAWLAMPDDDAPPECVEWEGFDPEAGNLEPEILGALCEILAGHTTTPAACWFCMWAGYGWLHPAIAVSTAWPTVGPYSIAPAAPGEAAPAPLRVPTRPPRAPAPTRPLVELPHREYLLFSGPLAGAREVGEGSSGLFPQSPNLFWPDDHAWCVATEIDIDSTYIGCSEEAARALLADDRLETWRVEPDDPITADSDLINGGDGDPPPR